MVYQECFPEHPFRSGIIGQKLGHEVSTYAGQIHQGEVSESKRKHVPFGEVLLSWQVFEVAA